MTHKPRHTLGVVPAEAGTHNPKCKSLRDAGITSPVHNICCGVWVPAFAGTTAVNAEPPTVQPRALMTAPISSANLSAKGRRQGGPS